MHKMLDNRLQSVSRIIYQNVQLHNSLSAKRLEHELTLESLSYEQARWKLKAENQEWIKEKLTKKLQLTDIRLDTAKLELELLKRQYDLNHSKSDEVVNKE